jgi:hypothetical protein
VNPPLPRALPLFPQLVEVDALNMPPALPGVIDEPGDFALVLTYVEIRGPCKSAETRSTAGELAVELQVELEDVDPRLTQET